MNETDCLLIVFDGPKNGYFPVLMKCFNGFCSNGVVSADTVGEILQMMGLRVKKEALQAIIEEVDEDGKNKLIQYLYGASRITRLCHR